MLTSKLMNFHYYTHANQKNIVSIRLYNFIIIKTYKTFIALIG